MVASAIYFLDAKGKVLISRNYRGDVTRAAVDKCVRARPENAPAATRRLTSA
jgi:hypothetical protein